MRLTTVNPGSDLSARQIQIALEYLAAMGVPRRQEWAPSQLARDLGKTTRTWQRRCESGEIAAETRGRGYVVTWPSIVRYFAERGVRPRE